MGVRAAAVLCGMLPLLVHDAKKVAKNVEVQDAGVDGSPFVLGLAGSLLRSVCPVCVSEGMWRATASCRPRRKYAL